MIKRLLPILLIVTFAATAKDNLANSDLQLKNSLLWKISGNELTEPSYLYGTMHLLCDKSNSEKAKVQNAVNASEKLYLEIDMYNPKEAMSVMQLMSEETKIKDLEDKEKKDLLLKLAEEHLGMKGTLIENTTVFSVFSMMAFKATDDCALPSSVEESLDAKFNSDRSKIAGLETMAQQMEFIRESEVANLDNTIIGLQEFDEMKDMYDDMSEHYMSENINALYAMMTQTSDLYTQEYLDKMMEILLVKRNKNWTVQIPEIAAKQPTFFGVGAGHLPGENGVINLLRKDGYTVEAVMDQ